MLDTCDYNQIKENFPWIIERNRLCVISPDLDGILTSILLSHFLDWQVVGMYSINDLFLLKKWLKKRRPEIAEKLIESNNLVFVDHDIYRSDILSVGHHLLQWSRDTPIPNHTEKKSSLNPNLIRCITKKEFNRKYPYGTFHFLLACFSAWKILGDFSPDDELTTLILHVDSSFESSIKYQDNALDWLNWLGGSEEKSPLYPICKRMLRFNPKVIIENFKKLACYFEEFGLRPRGQATLNNPEDKNQWNCLEKLVKWFEKKSGWKSKIPNFPNEEVLHFKVKRKSDKPNKDIFENTIRKNPFSYAIISSGEGGFNFGWIEN